MCLTIKSGPFIASKDIIVWKDVILHKNYSISFYYDYKYLPNKINPCETLSVCKIKKTINEFYELCELGIFKGYHSYKNFSIINCNRFVIPKGSQYYIGINNDIVSDRIIWKPTIFEKIIMMFK